MKIPTTPCKHTLRERGLMKFSGETELELIPRCRVPRLFEIHFDGLGLFAAVTLLKLEGNFLDESFNFVPCTHIPPPIYTHAEKKTISSN